MNLGPKIDPLITAGAVLGPNTAKGTEQSAKKAAHDFESFLIFTILKEFDKTTHYSKKGYAQETQMALLYEKVGDFLAKKGIGIKEMLMKYTERGAKVFDKNGDNKKVGGVR